MEYKLLYNSTNQFTTYLFTSHIPILNFSPPLRNFKLNFMKCKFHIHSKFHIQFHIQYTIICSL